MSRETTDVATDLEGLYSRDGHVVITGGPIVAEKPVFLHCRMKPEFLAMLDELIVHHMEDDRSSMVRRMIKDYHAKMAREKAKKAKEEGQ